MVFEKNFISIFADFAFLSCYVFEKYVNCLQILNYIQFGVSFCLIC